MAAKDRSAKDPDALVPLGYVAGAHGLEGELRVKLFHAQSKAVRAGARVFLTRSEERHEHLVVRASPVGPLARVKLRGIDSKDAAEGLRGFELAVLRSALPKPGADEVYLTDLVGLRAVVGETEVGLVERVLSHPASDCLRIKVEGGYREVPLTAPYLIEVDLSSGCVRLAHIEDFDLVK